MHRRLARGSFKIRRGSSHFNSLVLHSPYVLFSSKKSQYSNDDSDEQVHIEILSNRCMYRIAPVKPVKFDHGSIRTCVLP